MLGCDGALVYSALVLPHGASERGPAVCCLDRSIRWGEPRLLSQPASSCPVGAVSALFSLPPVFRLPATSFYPNSGVRSGEFLRALDPNHM